MWMLFDGSYFLHRALHVESYALMESEGKPTGGILGTLKEVRKCLSDFNPTHALIVWDSGLSLRRYTIYPEYKVRKKPKSIRKIKESRKHHSLYESHRYLLNEHFPVFGVRSVLVIPNVQCAFEGDDLLFAVARIIQDEMGEDCIIVSDDKDLLQCVDKKISVYRPMANQYIDEKDFTVSTGCNGVMCHLIERAIVGDTSDNIEGVPGIGEKTASEALDSFHRAGRSDHLSMVGEFTSHCSKSSSKRVRNLSEYSSYIRILRNLQLMDLRMEEIPKKASSYLRKMLKRKSMVCVKDSREVCKNYRFQSLLDRYSSWLAPFKKLR